MSKLVKVGKYTYGLSSRKNKKLFTIIDGKSIHFGNSKYEHYKDKTKLLDFKLNHNDLERRKNYLARSISIKDGNGKLTYNNPSSPNYHSINILW